MKYANKQSIYWIPIRWHRFWLLSQKFKDQGCTPVWVPTHDVCLPPEGITCVRVCVGPISNIAKFISSLLHWVTDAIVYDASERTIRQGIDVYIHISICSVRIACLQVNGPHTNWLVLSTPVNCGPVLCLDTKHSSTDACKPSRETAHWRAAWSHHWTDRGCCPKKCLVEKTSPKFH